MSEFIIDQAEAIEMLKLMLEAAQVRFQMPGHNGSDGVTMAAGNIQLGIYVKVSPIPGRGRALVEGVARLECSMAGAKPIVDTNIEDLIRNKNSNKSPHHN